MSKILEKAFDASKKIIRSIFNGSPNLITTSDLNRQFEALKHQADRLDEKTGFLIEGSNLWFKLDGSTLKVNLSYKTMEYKGCVFNPKRSTTVEVNFTASAPYAYFCLVADKETLTYDTDVTHEIAGAKFADGTSMRAADQIIYKNEKFVLTHSVESLNNFVGIIAFFKLINGKVYASENWTDFYSPLRVKDGSGSVSSDFETSQKYPIKIGDTYDVAFGKLQGFLGGAKVYNGGWGFFQPKFNEISETEYKDMLVNSPAKLVKVGPIYYVRLLGLTTGEGIRKDKVHYNLRMLILNLSTDLSGIVMFKDLPSTYNIGRFIGAAIGLSPLLEIERLEEGVVKAQQSIDSLSVRSSYLGDINSLNVPNSFGFSLRTTGNYDSSKFTFGTSIISQDGEGIDLTLMFADSNIW